MRKKFISLCLALGVLVSLPSQALGYSLNGWGPQLDSGGTSYSYLVEVCVTSSTGSNVWDTAGIPLHARAQNAMAQWNDNTNGEFFFQVSNSCANHGYDLYSPYFENQIMIEKANYGDTGWKAQLTGTVGGVCTGGEPWYPSCYAHMLLKINLYYPWWNQAGTPNPNQYDLFSAFTHELGHAFSAPDLAMWVHADCLQGTGSSSMCDSFGLGSTWRRTPNSADISAYISRYGTTH